MYQTSYCVVVPRGTTNVRYSKFRYDSITSSIKSTSHGLCNASIFHSIIKTLYNWPVSCNRVYRFLHGEGQQCGYCGKVLSSWWFCPIMYIFVFNEPWMVYSLPPSSGDHLIWDSTKGLEHTEHGWLMFSRENNSLRSGVVTQRRQLIAIKHIG